MSDVTHILAELRAGDATAAARLFEAAYGELRRLAAAKMAREMAAQTLQPTALVHEAWLRLGGDQVQNWDSRSHFFGAAAEAMRRILVDQARRRATLRRGGAQQRVPLTELEVPACVESDDLLQVHEVLESLEREHPDKAQLVKLRYFMGLTLEQCADVLGLSLATVKRQWTFARAWMLRALQNPPPG